MTQTQNCIDITPFLNEDLGSGDITAAIISADQNATAELLTREPMILCGREWFDAVFRYLDATISIEWHALEGFNRKVGVSGAHESESLFKAMTESVE